MPSNKRSRNSSTGSASPTDNTSLGSAPQAAAKRTRGNASITGQRYMPALLPRGPAAAPPPPPKPKRGASKYDIDNSDMSPAQQARLATLSQKKKHGRPTEMFATPLQHAWTGAPQMARPAVATQEHVIRRAIHGFIPGNVSLASETEKKKEFKRAKDPEKRGRGSRKPTTKGAAAASKPLRGAVSEATPEAIARAMALRGMHTYTQAPAPAPAQRASVPVIPTMPVQQAPPATAPAARAESEEFPDDFLLMTMEWAKMEKTIPGGMSGAERTNIGESEWDELFPAPKR